MAILPKHSEMQVSQRLYRRWSLLLAPLLLSAYFYSAPSYTTLEDASEFILSAHLLGLPHPPGYPLFVMLAHPLHWLSFLTPALSISLLSMLATTFTAFLVGHVVLRASASVLPALFAFLLFGTMEIPWSQAIVVEVYALQALLLMGLLHLGLYGDEAAPRFWAPAWAFLWALSCSNHWPLTLLASPAFICLLWPKRALFWRQRWAVGGFFLLGFTPYLYLFLPSDADFSFSGPISTIQDFWKYVSRREFNVRPTAAHLQWQDRLIFAKDYLRSLLFDHGAGTLLLGLLGFAQLIRQRSRLALVLLLGMASTSFLLLLVWKMEYDALSRDIFASFQGFGFACFACLAGLGLAWLLPLIKARLARAAFAFLLACVLVGTTVPVFQKMQGFKDPFLEAYTDLILNSLPQGAVLLSSGDADAGPLAYARFLTKQRPDLELVSAIGSLLPHKIFVRNQDVKRGAHREKIVRFIDQRIETGHRVFSIESIPYFNEKYPLPFHQVNYGWFWEFAKSENPPVFDLESLSRKSAKLMDIAMQENEAAPFRYLRWKLVESGCRFHVILGVDHPALKALVPCQFPMGQWFFWEAQDFVNADRRFLAALKGYAAWPLTEKLEMARRVLDTRERILSALASEGERQALRLETWQILSPYLEAWRSCANPLIPGLLNFAQKTDSVLQQCP